LELHYRMLFMGVMLRRRVSISFEELSELNKRVYIIYRIRKKMRSKPKLVDNNFLENLKKNIKLRNKNYLSLKVNLGIILIICLIFVFLFYIYTEKTEKTERTENS